MPQPTENLQPSQPNQFVWGLVGGTKWGTATHITRRNGRIVGTSTAAVLDMQMEQEESLGLRVALSIKYGTTPTGEIDWPNISSSSNEGEMTMAKKATTPPPAPRPGCISEAIALAAIKAAAFQKGK